MANPREVGTQMLNLDAFDKLTAEERINILSQIILNNPQRPSAEEIRITDKLTDDYETTKVGPNGYEK